jgi:hypothetical protein
MLQWLSISAVNDSDNLPATFVLLRIPSGISVSKNVVAFDGGCNKRHANVRVKTCSAGQTTLPQTYLPFPECRAFSSCLFSPLTVSHELFANRIHINDCLSLLVKGMKHSNINLMSDSRLLHVFTCINTDSLCPFFIGSRVSLHEVAYNLDTLTSDKQLSR